MSAMISDRDIIRLHLSLELPRMVGEMLDRRLPIADDEAYALEVALSEMTSEKFLLAAACVARYMALEKFLDEELQVALSLQADVAFDDYAPRYLAGLKHSMKQTCSGYAMYMQEDLESFADLFSMAADIPSGSAALRDISMILSDQAAAHAEAMTIEDDLFDYDELFTTDYRSSPIVASDVPDDNVVLFPIIARRPAN